MEHKSNSAHRCTAIHFPFPPTGKISDAPPWKNIRLLYRISSWQEENKGWGGFVTAPNNSNWRYAQKKKSQRSHTCSRYKYTNMDDRYRIYWSSVHRIWNLRCFKIWLFFPFSLCLIIPAYYYYLFEYSNQDERRHVFNISIIRQSLDSCVV